MACVQTAIHLRTAEPDVTRVVDGWLCRHAVRTVTLADVYEACVHLLRHHADVPDLAFIGADWLRTEDGAILGYLRATWPSVAIVVYSSGQRGLVGQADPRQRVCTSVQALRELLADPPGRLLECIYGEANGRPAVAVSLVGESENASLRPTAREIPSCAGSPGLQRVEPEADPPRSILTHEELSALLDEDEA